MILAALATILMDAQSVQITCPLAGELLDAVEARGAYLGGELDATGVEVEKILLSRELFALFQLKQEVLFWQAQNCNEENTNDNEE